ncbi:hypothetical protein EMIT048CA2_120105 [Pseudomonas chlororaphis]
MKTKGCMNLSTDRSVPKNKHKNKDLINFFLFNFYCP